MTGEGCPGFPPTPAFTPTEEALFILGHAIQRALFLGGEPLGGLPHTPAEARVLAEKLAAFVSKDLEERLTFQQKLQEGIAQVEQMLPKVERLIATVERERDEAEDACVWGFMEFKPWDGDGGGEEPNPEEALRRLQVIAERCFARRSAQRKGK